MLYGNVLKIGALGALPPFHLLPCMLEQQLSMVRRCSCLNSVPQTAIRGGGREGGEDIHDALVSVTFLRNV